MTARMLGSGRASRRCAAFFVGGVALLAATLTPARARADEPEPIAVYHPDRVPPSSAKLTLGLVGGGLFALSYGAALGSSFVWEGDPGSADLRIPIVGPWMKIGRTELCEQEIDGCSNALQVAGAVASGFGGVLQVAALALLVDAILLPSSPTEAPSEGSGFVRVVPILGTSGTSSGASTYGVSVFGAF